MTDVRFGADEPSLDWGLCGCRPLVPNISASAEPTLLPESELDRLVEEGRVMRLGDYAASLLALLDMFDLDQAAEHLLEGVRTRPMPDELVAAYGSQIAARRASDAGQLAMKSRRRDGRAIFGMLMGEEELARVSGDDNWAAASLTVEFGKFIRQYAGAKRADARVALQQVLRSYLPDVDLPES